MPAPAGAIYLTDIGLSYKPLVVVSGRKVLDATDFRKILVGAGTSSQIIEIPNYAMTPFSMTAGFPVFSMFRPTAGSIDANPPQTVQDRGTVAARTSLTTAIVGDSCTESGSGITYVLTTAGGGTAGNWTALPAGAPGQVSIYNPRSREVGLYEAASVFMFGPNQWAWL
jgi:hypothetical protein